MAALLEVQAISLRKRSTDLLKNISFSLGKGEVFAVTGHSGSGKSTLLLLLSRLQEPSSGEIRFAQKPYRDFDPRILRRHLTLVFQTPVLMAGTVFDNLRLGLELFPIQGNGDESGSREWGAKLLTRVHLSPDLLDENPKQLSVGEAQRVALARALAIKPQVLLLDEPTSALDLQSKQAIEASLRESAQEGLSIVLVTHDPRQLQELANHGIELHKGEMLRHW